jgi:cysteine desulfurase
VQSGDFVPRIYLDYNAGAPLDPRAQELIQRLLSLHGNPSSIHWEGRRMRGLLDEAREKVALLLGCEPSEVVFTSGGTESCLLGIAGVARALRDKGRHIITTAVEHHAVLETCRYLASKEGFSLTVLPVDRFGRVDPEELRVALRADTVLVSVMSANNETGTRQPLEAIGSVCAEAGVALHVDAVQSPGREAVELARWQATAVSFSAHKFHGPQGVGIVVLRKGVPVEAVLRGGSQEGGRRAGTENVLGAIAAAEALAAAEELRPREAPRLFQLVERLWSEIQSLEGIERHGDPVERLPNTLQVSFSGLSGEELLIGLDLAGLAVSSGSACVVGALQPSHVLLAMGVPRERAAASLRFSLGRETTEGEIQEAARRVREVVTLQREVLSRGALAGSF